jgi:hypothetical protein
MEELEERNVCIGGGSDGGRLEERTTARTWSFLARIEESRISRYGVANRLFTA